MIINKNWHFTDTKLNLARVNRNNFIKSNAIFDIFDWSDKKYYYVPLDFGIEFDLKFIPEYFQTQILSNKLTVIIHNELEATLQVLDFVYEYFILKHKIYNIIYFSNNPNAHIRCAELAKKYNAPIIKCYLAMEFEYHTAKYFVEKNLINEMTDFNGNKKFLNLNRVWRTHRPTLVSLLYLENLLQFGHVSLGVSERQNFCNYEYALPLMIKSNPSLQVYFETNKEKILSIPHMYLDQNDLNVNWNMPLEDTKKYYKDSLCSVISETYFYETELYHGFRTNPPDPCVFLTEKTFKPILEGHPFIMVSRPNTLKFLHKLGYKTFHPFIDESYDSIENDTERIIEVVRQIKNLCYIDGADFYKSIKNIVIHNRDLILNKLNSPKTSYCYELPL